MTPENETKKAYLLRYLEAKRDELRIEQDIEQYRLSALPSAISYDGVGGGSAVPHGYETYAAKLSDLFEKATAQLERSHAVRRSIVNAIEALPNETERSVMKTRYLFLDELRINGHITGYGLKHWDAIDKILFLSDGYASQVHGRALQHLVIPGDSKTI